MIFCIKSRFTIGNNSVIIYCVNIVRIREVISYNEYRFSKNTFPAPQRTWTYTKQVAADLGIAQALLSHYEKGKRECGLEFLVKAADYYNVSTDYLLGRSPVSNGGIITESDIPDGNSSGDSKSGDIMLALNKKLITNSIEVIFSILQKIKSSKLSKSVSSMLTLSVYKAFRITYNANRKNDDNLFGVSPTSALHLIDSAIFLEVGAAADAANDADNAPSITTNSIEAEYDKQGTALLSLIKNAEKRLDRINTD